jgi:hypothetical protein
VQFRKNTPEMSVVSLTEPEKSYVLVQQRNYAEIVSLLRSIDAPQ